MDREFETICIEFNNKAQKLFFSLFQKFNDSAGHFDRRKDENVFKLQQNKYLYTLKEQLEAIVKELLYKNRSLKNISRLNKTLTDEISAYLNAFRQKSGSV